MSQASEQKLGGGLKIWFLETRPQFLILSIVLIFLGAAVASYEGFFHPLYLALGGIGLLLLHMSVNTLNDYFDYKTGIDLEVERTPFSGGSGILPAGLLSHSSVYRFGIICFIATVPLGIYFLLVRGWSLAPVLAIGAICALFYTKYLTRFPIAEVAAGLGLGTLPVLGLFFVQSGAYAPAIAASVLSGILVWNLLFLNEFPDIEADRKGGRRHLAITLGKRKAAYLYSAITIVVYVWIVVMVIARLMPPFTLLGLLTIPFARKAIAGALNFEDKSKFLPGMGANVMVVLVTQALVALGYIVAALLA